METPDFAEVPDHEDETTCCIKIGLKGCSFDYHCCTGYCEESRCVYSDGEYPGDAPGGRKVRLQ